MYRQLVYYGVSRVVPAVLSLVFTVACAQQLSLAEYGVYTLTALPALIAAAFAAGLAGQPMLRYATMLSSRGRQTGLFRVPLGASLFLVPAVAAYMLGIGHPAVLVMLALGLIPLTALVDTRRNYYVSHSRVLAVLLLDGTRSLASVVLLLSLFASGLRDSRAPLLALLGAAAAALIVAAWRDEPEDAPGTVDIGPEYLGYGFWLASWLMLIGVFPYAERWLLNTRFDVGVVGSYSVLADPLVALSSASTAVIVSAFMPRYVKAWHEGRESEIAKLSRVAVAGTLGLAVLIFLLGAGIRALGMGRYGVLLRESAELGVWLLVASTTWQVGIFVHKRMELAGRTKTMFGCLIVAGILFLAVTGPLVERWGAPGMAMAKTLGGLAYAGLAYIAGRGEVASAAAAT